MADRRPVGFGRRDGDAAGEDAGVVVPAGVTRLDDETMARLLPVRDARGHKGTFGKLLVIAGSLDYAGAALLVCRAAGRAGAGLVTLAVPESLQPLFAGKVVEATTMALPEDDVEEVDPEPALAMILDHQHDALVIGPGVRPSLATADLLRLILTVPDEAVPAPAVLDAEALRTLASADAWWTGVTRPCVLTPHAGEFVRLRTGSGHEAGEDGDLTADDTARARAASAAASEWRQVVVLKGANTVIASPDGRASLAAFENPAMASGGTGDVLAGMIGALLAQGLAPYDAARLGVYLHAHAGELVRERIGDAGLLASDLPDAVPMVRKRLARIAERQRTGRRLGFGAWDGEPVLPVEPAPANATSPEVADGAEATDGPAATPDLAAGARRTGPPA